MKDGGSLFYGAVPRDYHSRAERELSVLTCRGFVQSKWSKTVGGLPGKTGGVLKWENNERDQSSRRTRRRGKKDWGGGNLAFKRVGGWCRKKNHWPGHQSRLLVAGTVTKQGAIYGELTRHN